MKIKRLLLTSLFGLSLAILNAQTIKETHQNGSQSLITFEEKADSNDSKKNANTSTNKSPEQILQEYLNLNSNDEFKVVKKTTDNLGYDHFKYQQYYKGIKVDFATYNVHYKNGKPHAINGDFKRITTLKTNPSVSENQSLNIALNHIDANQYAWGEINTELSLPKAELVIVEASSQKVKAMKLAYKFNIQAVAPIYHADIYVDAHTGKILLENNKVHNCLKKEDIDSNHNVSLGKRLIKTATVRKSALPLVTGQGKTWYSGLQSIESSENPTGEYILHDQTRNIRTRNDDLTDFISGTSSWFLNAPDDDINRSALDAHWGVGQTYDYFNDVHNWLSFNNDIDSPISIEVLMESGDKASWNGAQIKLGKTGFKTSDPHPMSTIDIVAHEYTHALIEYTAELTYVQGAESGALNEGICDIFGAAVEYHFFPDRETWISGELTAPSTLYNTIVSGVRNLENPKIGGIFGKNPDTYNGEFWKSTGNNVHNNSTIVSHWFYLLSEGKSGVNDNGANYNVTGIGIDKAADIIFRTLTVYMTSNTDYKTIRSLSIQAATDLYGANSQEVTQVKKSWDAVGVYSYFFDVISPSLNEELFAGLTKEITWQQSEDYPQVDISMSTNGGETYPIILATNVANTGSFTFTVPKQYGNHNKIKVIASSSSSVDISIGFSQEFKIDGSITSFPYIMNFENGIENWKINDSGGWRIVSSPRLQGYGPDTAPSNGEHYIQSINPTNFILTSPSIELPSTGDIELKYDINLFQDIPDGNLDINKVNTLIMQISEDDGITWENGNSNITLPWYAGDTNSWMKWTNDLRAYKGAKIKIRFVYKKPADNTSIWRSGQASIENIRILHTVAKTKTIISSESQLTLFPNPANDRLNIIIPGSIINNDQFLYAISNVTGAEITNGTFNEKSNTVNVSQLPRGIYFISIKSDTEIYTKKFIKR